MSTFKGFSDKDTFTQIPDAFFHHILNQSDDPLEIKVTLYVLWRIAHMESHSMSLCRSEIMGDEAFMGGISESELDAGLEKALQRGSLLRVENEKDGFYFLNSPGGRAAAEALEKGDWRDAEKVYSEDQIAYAFEEAVRRNKCTWKYVEAILRNRKEEMDGKEQDRRDPEKDRRRYIEDEF